MSILFKNLAKIPAVLALLLLMSHNSFAQCNGKTISVKLPADWGATIYVVWPYSGSSYSVTPNLSGDGWRTFTMPSYSYDDANRYFYLYKNTIGTSGNSIIGSSYGFNVSFSGGYPSETSGISCSALSSYTYIYENPVNPGSTIVSSTPPNAYNFYFLPPDDPEWVLGNPYLVWFDGGALHKEKLKLDVSRCGWFKRTWFNATPPSGITLIWLNENGNDQLGLRGLAEDPMDWIGGLPTPFNLMEQFQTIVGGPGDLFFIPALGSNGWGKTDRGQVGVCSYNFAAIIYDTDGSVNSSFLQSNTESGTGIRKNIPQNVLAPDAQGVMKMQFNTAKNGWTQQNFMDAFKSTPGKNVVRCYDMPFKRNKEGLWEFNSNKLCRLNNMVDLDGNCSNYGGFMGGFFPDELQTAGDGDYSQCAACRNTHTAESFVPLNNTISQYCYDRGRNGTWTGEGTGACGAEFIEGNFSDGTTPGIWDWGATRPTIPNKNALFCFESAPAELTYEAGQQFFFSGDDDIWVYISNQLVIDLGGSHLAVPGYVNLDDLVISPAAQAVTKNSDGKQKQFTPQGKLVEGEKYPINIFFCDRRLTMSNVRITTDMYFAQKNLLTISGNAQGNGAEICIESNGSAGTCAEVMSGSSVGGTRCGGELGNILDYYMLDRRGNSTGFELNASNPQCRKVGDNLVCFDGIILENYYKNPVGVVDKVTVNRAALTDLMGTYRVYAKINEANIASFPTAVPLFITTVLAEIVDSENGLYTQNVERGKEICLKEAGTSICGIELAPRLYYAIAVPGVGFIDLDAANINCVWSNETRGVCYGGINLRNGVVLIDEGAITNNILRNGFEIYASVDGYQLLNVSNAAPVSIAKAPRIIKEQEPRYYTLKGEPLGKQKPKRAGVYIVRQNGTTKLIVEK